MPSDPSEILIPSDDGEQPLGSLLEAYRPRLERMLHVRMDARLRRRLDAADVLQEAYVEVTERLDEWLARRDLPFFLWVRFLTGQKLAQVQRRHLGTAARDARQEDSLRRLAAPDATSVNLASVLLDTGLSPSQVNMRSEEREALEQALESMGAHDREILALRHFERLSNAEAAALLELTESGASRRYVRALSRLQEVLERLGG